MTTPHDKALEAFQIEEVQMVEYVDGFKQPADPMYRIVANGYCADFPSRAAAENFRREFSSAAVSAYLSSIGGVIVPVEPTDELLRSMAIRYDHGLGVPGYYDQRVFGAENVGHARRMESTIRTMHQLHEEVVGKGFYRPSLHAPIPEGGNGDGWLPIETAPRDGTVISAWHTVHKCPMSVLWKDEGFPFRGERLNWYERSYTTAWPERCFSHWCPLPAPPSTPSHEGRKKA